MTTQDWQECELDKGQDNVIWRLHKSGQYVEVQDFEGTPIGTLPKEANETHVFAMMRGFHIGHECGEASGKYLKAMEIQKALHFPNNKSTNAEGNGDTI